jgi:hypothetical protein
MFDGAQDDWVMGDPLGGKLIEWRWTRPLVLAAAVAALSIALATSAFAQASAALSRCDQTVTTGSAPVVFPTATTTGPSAPQSYFMICNAHASNTLGVNLTGGTAAIGSAGTLTLQPGGCLWRDKFPIPPAVTIIGSASGTTTACWYK